MKSQKFLPFLVILIGFLILIVIGGCVSQGNLSDSKTETTRDLLSSHFGATPENLQFIDFHFTPLDSTDNRLKNAISQDQAVLAALQFESRGKTATSVTTQVGFSDGVMVMDLSKDRLVWLVTFHGVDTVSSGPPGSIHRVSHELTVAVDAYQGSGIVSMTLGIVSPQPKERLTSVSTPAPIPSSTAEVQLPVQIPSMVIGKGNPTSLAVSPNGLWMAVSTQFGVYMYYANEFEQSWWFTPLPEKAGLVVFNRQSDRLGVATGSEIVILDAVSGKLLARLENAGDSFAWSPDGQRLVSGSGCQQVTVWDASNGAALKELSGGKCSEGYSGIKVTWAAKGRIYGVSMGTKIQAWDGDTYSPVEGFSAEGAKDTWISEILAAPAGNLLAQYDSMGYPIVAVIDGKQDRQIHLLDQQVNGPITALAWAQDGQHLAVAYGMNIGLILIWNAQTGQVEHKLEGFYTAAGLGWSTDGDTLFGPQSLNGRINAIAVNTGQALRSVSGHAFAGNFLTWTMKDNLVTTNGMTITRWADLTGEPLQQETVGSPQEMVVSWSPTGPGTYLFSSPERGHEVGTNNSKRPLAGDNNQYPFPTAWSFDGSRLAGPADVWDAGTGKLLAQLHDPAEQHVPDQVAWSPDGKRLASADSLNMQSPVIWDSQTGQVLITLQVETGELKPLWLGLAWSPDGKKLAAVGSLMHPADGTDEGMILIWDAQTGQQEQLLSAGMHGYRLWAVAWSPDSRFLACGTTGSEIFVWNMVNHTPLARLQGHRDIIDRLAWSPDNNYLALASVARDGTLQIWNLSSLTAP
jgi:WD40 repeat protein